MTINTSIVTAKSWMMLVNDPGFGLASEAFLGTILTYLRVVELISMKRLSKLHRRLCVHNRSGRLGFNCVTASMECGATLLATRNCLQVGFWVGAFATGE